MKAPRLRGAKIDSKFVPRSYGDFVHCPAEFWTPRSLPSGAMEHCNLCTANSQRNSCRDQNNHKNWVIQRFRMTKSIYLQSFFIFLFICIFLAGNDDYSNYFVQHKKKSDTWLPMLNFFVYIGCDSHAELKYNTIALLQYLYNKPTE